MEAIKSRGIAKDGKLVISVPASLNEQELEVIVFSAGLPRLVRNTVQNEEKIKQLMSIVGTARYPDLSDDVLDVYEQ